MVQTSHSRKSRFKLLIQQRQLKPLKGIIADMDAKDWNELDALAKSIVGFHLTKSMYFIVVNEKTTHELWMKLCATYEKETASNKVYLMKQLFELQMKEGVSIASHLNEFNIIFTQLQAQKLNFDAEMKAIFLLCSLPSSWDTFHKL